MGTIKRLNASNFDDVFQLSQFAFQYKLSPEELKKKKEEAANHLIWGWLEEEKLAAKVHMIPLTCFIGGETFEMGGISSVATWPEYRRNGMIKHLLAHTLQYMKQAGQTVSFLHPFSFAFYRKYGWEHVFNLKNYVIPMKKMKGVWSGKGYVRRSRIDTPELNAIYTDYARKFTGTLARDDKWWQQRVFKNEEQLAIAYNKDNQPEGYIHYQVKDHELMVKELVYRSVNGWELLLEFIANHDSMANTVKMSLPENDPLTDLMNEPDFEQTIEPYFMARVVDVLSFLQKYPFKETTSSQSVTLSVTDEFFPDNDGIYQLHADKKEVTVSYVKSEMDDQDAVHCSIQQFTQMFLGYKRPLELYELGLIKGSKESAEKLEALIPNQQTYYTRADFF